MNRRDWAKIHTHIHTILSDGGSSLLEMAKAHQERGFDAFYVTDHNTSSAMGEAMEVWHADRINWVENAHLWTELLNRGIRLSALAGLDAHNSEEVRKSPLATYVRLSGEGSLEEKIFRSMKKGDRVPSGFGEEESPLTISCRLDLPHPDWCSPGDEPLKWLRVEMVREDEFTRRVQTMTNPLYFG